MTETATAADHTWFGERYEGLMEAYCISLVQGLGPEELLRALGAEPEVRITGVDALHEPSYEGWSHDRLFVGAAPLDGWSLMVEANGYLGVTDEAMLPVSRGRRVVSHFRNINAVDHFSWYEDGTVRLHFEPLFANCRDGTHPDELLAEMRESGFDLGEEDPDHEAHTEAAFALAQRITGIRLTPGLLDSAQFVCAHAPVPR